MKRVVALLLVTMAVCLAGVVKPMFRVNLAGLSLGELVSFSGKSHMSMSGRVAELAGGARFGPQLGAMLGLTGIYANDVLLGTVPVSGYVVWDLTPKGRWRRAVAYGVGTYVFNISEHAFETKPKQYVCFGAGLDYTFYALSPHLLANYLPGKPGGIAIALGLNLGGTYVGR